MFCEQPPLSGAPQVEAASIQQPDRQEEEPQVISSNDAMVLTAAAFRQAAERIRPSLVTIESFGGVSAVQGRIGGIRKQGEGNTTGVLISAEGHIVTSTFNFIQLPPVITVITADGERRVASLLGRDEIRKICLLKVEPFSGIQVPELVELDDIRIGQWAISVGVGYGDLNPAISTGIISATNRIGGRAIQTDANISPANYGGPLLDIEGRMIGICVPMNPQSQAVGAGVEWYDSGIGFAVPLAGADKLLARLKNGERIYPAFLGVLATTDPGANGVRIQQIVPDSAAAGLQLKAGDLIREIDGLPVNDLAEMKRVLNRLEAGDEISIVVVSQDDDASKEMQVVLGPPPAPANDDAPFEPPKIR
jgi:serine protease Do